MRDYALIFSTTMLMNVVFVGLFLAALLSRDITPKESVGYYAGAFFWFTLGCGIPALSMLDRDPADQYKNAVLSLVGTLVIFLFVILGLSFRAVNAKGMLRGPTKKIFEVLSKVFVDTDKVNPKYFREDRRAQRQALRQAIDSGQIRGLPK